MTIRATGHMKRKEPIMKAEDSQKHHVELHDREK